VNSILINSHVFATITAYINILRKANGLSSFLNFMLLYMCEESVHVISTIAILLYHYLQMCWCTSTKKYVGSRGGSRIGTVELQHLLLTLDIIDNI
jgi:hypothetical protein